MLQYKIGRVREVVNSHNDTRGQKGRSECSFSGQQDDDSNEGVFKSDRTQSWGQLFNEIRLMLIKSGFTPGSKFGLPGLGSCNTNAE